ncbi:MAG: polyphosphate polymerase domain-containing protein [Clostridia bacterium]|nr:polyphosphate polymerase domain-containing protein [Clostridia bacterium]
MEYQKIFKRYEIKYLISESQKQDIISAILPYMALDKYGRSEIRNIYFDTENYRLIRSSIEKPVYKEKLRIRSYGRVNGADAVFVEIKKKYDKVVYKRRVALPYGEAFLWLTEGKRVLNTQISREIDYFCEYYKALLPKAFISYEREAYFMKDGSDFRVTFDDNIQARSTDISLMSEAYGVPLLDKGKILMEIKCAGGIPLWLVSALSHGKIYKTSFSKYGTFYQKELLMGGYKNERNFCGNI